MSARANPRLAALQHKVIEERRRRGDAGYNDDHVKRIAVHLVVEDIELPDCTAAQSLAIGGQLGLSVTQYLGAVEWLDPEHAEMLRRSRP